MSKLKRKYSRIVAGVAVLLASAMPCYATVVTFEDISPDDLADGYGGISGWTSAGSIFSGTGEGVGNYLFYGNEGEVRFDSAPVTFEGTYYKAYAIDTSAPPITGIELFYQGLLVHSILDPQAPLALEWVASGYTGLIDKIYFRGGGEGFAIDNLTYTQATSPVPLPGAIPLFLSGAGLIAAARTRRKQTQQ
jgi:hypothetical protein